MSDDETRSVVDITAVTIGQWENELYLTVCPVHGLIAGLVSAYFKGFSLANHTLPTSSGPRRHKMTHSPLNGTTRLVDIKEGDLRPTTDR